MDKAAKGDQTVSHIIIIIIIIIIVSIIIIIEEGGVAQSVARANPGQKVLGSIPAVATRSLLIGWVSV